MKKKPLIGLFLPGTEELVKERQEPYISLENRYLISVGLAGGIPLILPPVPEEEALSQFSLADGFLLCGGADLNPLLYGEDPHPRAGAFYEDRDRHEIQAARFALERGIPLLAICRGAQVVNTALGGTLYQDIPSQTDCPVCHWQQAADRYGTHRVSSEPGSRLREIFGEKFLTNSFHHQGIRETAPGLRVTARDSWGLPEGLEGENHPWYVAVQWHPEEMAFPGTDQLKLFRSFVEACPDKG